MVEELDRFLGAQEPVFDQVLAELRRGRKTSHWMWFIFPQIRGLGSSSMAIKFAISDLSEARAYFEHPVLGPRLVQCTELVNAVENRSIDDIFGYPDNLKFRSSMTLFARAAPEEQAFRTAIDKYFNGEFDSATDDLL
jgi:uncharacterized protein (DUF1810 family)